MFGKGKIGEDRGKKGMWKGRKGRIKEWGATKRMKGKGVEGKEREDEKRSKE